MLDDGLLADLAEQLEGTTETLRIPLVKLVQTEEGGGAPIEILERFPVSLITSQLREQEDLCRCPECHIWTRLIRMAELKNGDLICHQCRPDLARRDDPDAARVPRRGEDEEDADEEALPSGVEELDFERAFRYRDGGDDESGSDHPGDLALHVRHEP